MVTISDGVLHAAHMTEEELKLELAISLYEKERLSLAQARRLAGMNRWEFEEILWKKKIPMHYGIEELEQDIDTLKRLELNDRSK